MEPQKNHLKISISTDTILKVIAILVIAYLLLLVSDVVLIIITAIVIASAISPSARWFTDRGVPHALAVISIYFAGFILLAGMIFLFVPVFVSEMSTLLQNIPSQIGEVEMSTFFERSRLLGNLPFGEEGASLSDYLRELQSSVADYSEGIFRVISGVFGGILSFILVIVISFYLSMQRNGIEEFIKIVTPFKHQGYAVDLWKRTQMKIGKWIQGQFLLMLLVGFLTYIGLLILGVPNAFLFGLLAGLFEIIPIFGPILAAIPAIMVAYSYGGISLALMAVGLYIVVQQLESQVLYPQVVHKVVGIPSIVVLLALVTGAKLAGFIGIILAVPIAALIMEFAYDIEKRNMILAEAQMKNKVENEK